MFQKTFSLAAENKLSGKDTKQLRKNFLRLYPALTDEDVDPLLSANSKTIMKVRVKSPHRSVLYIENGFPVLLDTSGKGDLVPTLPALWTLPHILPKIYVKHFSVSKFILNGADLMLPGVAFPFGASFLAGALVSICIPGSDFPFAVGHTTLSSIQATNNVKKEGRLVQIVCTYGDLMSQHFSNLEPPNAGFTFTLISPVDPEELSEEPDSVPESSVEPTVEENPEETSIEAVDMDEMLRLCFFQALKKSVKNSDLPLPAGEFWLKHMHPNRQNEVDVDIKQSSYKKLSRFLQHFTSKDEPLLTLRVDKFSNETIITGINRKHEDYLKFEPYESSPTTKPEQDEEMEQGRDPVLVEELYRMGHELNQVLAALGMEAGCILPSKEAKNLVFEYIQTVGLDKGIPDSQHVVVDRVLGEALFKGYLKKNEKIPQYLAKSQLTEISSRRMHCMYRISRGDKEITKKGSLHPVQINEERRTGNKHVTRVSGLEHYFVDVAETSAEIRKKFGCATSLGEISQKGSTETELLVQGSKTREISIFLEKELLIPKQYIKAKK